MKIAVVTGANKGIGLAIVEKLCKTLGNNSHVYLTARNEERGQAAVASLKSKGCTPFFHKLDLEDSNSSAQLANFLKTKYGGLDVLINNAGSAYPWQVDSKVPFAEQAEVMLKTNFWGTSQVCESLFPLLRLNARVAHMSTRLGFMTLRKVSPALKKKLLSELTVEEVKQLMSEFLDAAKAGKHEELGWHSTSSMPKVQPSSAYEISKLGMTLLSMAQARQMQSNGQEDVLINACCPGYIKSDMTANKGTGTLEQGCDTAVFLATELPTGGPSGRFFMERKEKAWR